MIIEYFFLFCTAFKLVAKTLFYLMNISECLPLTQSNLKNLDLQGYYVSGVHLNLICVD